MKPIIEVVGLSKRYRLGQFGARTLREEAERIWEYFRGHSVPGRNGKSEFWALKDISFEVQPGEVIGIIGRNGSGKSTLLKILSRVTEPTVGEIRLRGRVASLLEVGTGFHPELTGRENIFLNGAILGMTKSEIRKKFDEIVAFAEIDEFLDTPVKRYSSGMYVRLAFAVAAHLEPEILVVDEVLAVGDAAFQQKCLGKMSDVARHGRTVLFVSHNMGVVNTLTERCLYLEHGKIVASGRSSEIVGAYLRKILEAPQAKSKDLSFHRRDANPEAPARITGIRLAGQRNGALPTIELGEGFTLEVELEVCRAVYGAYMTLALKTLHGQRATLIVSCDHNYTLLLRPGRHIVKARVKDLPLAPGQYLADIGIGQSLQSASFDLIQDFPLFCVVNNGQITHWVERPWGAVHCKDVKWESTMASYCGEVTENAATKQ
jgi:lipopolysaccharide transport system ATP-binding protein